MHNLYRAGAVALAMLWTSGLFAGEAPLSLSEARSEEHKSELQSRQYPV